MKKIRKTEVRIHLNLMWLQWMMDKLTLMWYNYIINRIRTRMEFTNHTNLFWSYSKVLIEVTKFQYPQLPLSLQTIKWMLKIPISNKQTNHSRMCSRNLLKDLKEEQIHLSATRGIKDLISKIWFKLKIKIMKK